MRHWLLVGLAACGRVAFDPASDALVDVLPADTDALLDAPADPLVVHWTFDDDPADGVADSSGLAHTAMCGTTCPTLTTGVTGGAYQFNGTSDAIVLPGTAAFDATGFAISLWLRADLPASTEQCFARKVYDTTGTSSWDLCALPNGVLRMCYSTANGTSCNSTPTNRYIPTFWHHVVMTSDGAFVRMYIEAGRWLEVPAGPLLYDTGQIRIGASFAGSLDEIRIYNRALTPAEITDLATP